MEGVVVAALITASGLVSAACINTVLPRMSSRVFRARNYIPDVLGTWDCEWFNGDVLYTKDQFTIVRWVRNNRIEGKGNDDRGCYVFSGEVESSRVVKCNYRDERYPKSARTGTFILNVSVDGRLMEGYWHGLTVEGDMRGGRVVCRKQA